MSKKHLFPNDLPLLLKEKGNICISIIAPTHRLSPERRTDALQLEKAIQQAKAYLETRYADKNTLPLIQAIDQLYDQIDFLHNAEGVGLFISENVKKLVHFFFPVRERIVISDSFEIRDLLYEFYYSTPYMVLLLSEKEVKLFNAKLNKLTEIKDEHFPRKYKEEYAYSHPTRGSSFVGYANVKEFEKDKSILEEIRIEMFFRETDHLLKEYLFNGTPLIVAGDTKILSAFRSITSHSKNIACNIPGNYLSLNESELGVLTWKAIKLFLDNKMEKPVNDFREKVGQGLGITGIENIWKAVMEGRGFKLLVEKDFSIPAYVKNTNDYELYLRPPKEPHKALPNVVNNLIETVLDKNGEVFLVENDILKDYGRIALITRY